MTALTGETSKAKDHAKAVKELRQALGAHRDAAAAEKALRELISMKVKSRTAPGHHARQGEATRPASDGARRDRERAGEAALI